MYWTFEKCNGISPPNIVVRNDNGNARRMNSSYPKNILESNWIPPDFYRFRHRVENKRDPQTRRLMSTPLWIVGVSPFDEVICAEAGYVVHIGQPQFMARWSQKPDFIDSYIHEGELSYHDLDMNILVHDLSWFDEAEKASIQTWLLEAACAVAYSRGHICELEPEQSGSC